MGLFGNRAKHRTAERKHLTSHKHTKAEEITTRKSSGEEDLCASFAGIYVEEGKKYSPHIN